MARRSKKPESKSEPKMIPDDEALPPITILSGSTLVCYEDGLVSFGPVTNIEEFGDFLFVIWDCWWLISPNTWTFREVINKDVLLAMRGIKSAKRARGHSGELVVTELMRRAFMLRNFVDEFGREMRVMTEERKGRRIVVYPPDVRIQPDQFFKPLEWYAVFYGFA